MEQNIVYVLTLSGTVLGVYSDHATAERTRLFKIHETKQRDARVWQCVVRSTEGF
jgi:hypothetical protein